MNVRLIASDMDGTLLNPYGIINPAVSLAVKKAQKAGIHFVICTGRPYDDAKKIMEKEGIFDCGYVCTSGGTVHDESGFCLVKSPMTEENVRTVAEIFDRHRISANILGETSRFCTGTYEERYQSLALFFNGNEPVPTPMPEELKMRVEQRFSQVRFVDAISDLADEGEIIFKILGDDLPLETVTLLKEEFSAHTDLAAASSFPTNIEITHITAQKGPALKAYAAKKGIPLESVMTIGDSDNDLTIIHPDFGWPVAMANAMDCIAKAAKYHTSSNEEDGVAQAILNLALGQE